MAAGGDDQWPTTGSHGHYFLKKNFHKPSYCHHCSDLVWGLLGQGYVCEENSFRWLMSVVNHDFAILFVKAAPPKNVFL
ncbi:hypothetical protein OUZ56_007151 [Daphnia magna]|uniref:Phorbol-ester/DAG-type domain-containing protein n=1 Tax=Daphnia magna TaxID=35525 RepID=A0ABQ9YXQ8_9CRUS|nr:hypothetical protein OUZ56_007151 [Daphnia magna]